MALMRSFKELVQKRVASDPGFGEARLAKASTPCSPAMSIPARRSCATTSRPCPRGNPQARNLFGIIGYLQKQAGVGLHVRQGPG